VFGWFFDSAVSWFASFVTAALQHLWNLLAATLLISPDVTGLPQVRLISGRSLLVANTCYVLVILAAGILVMTRETVQIRYGIGELAPRLVIGLVGANLATPLCSGLITLANGLTGALTEGPLGGPGAAQQLSRVVTSAVDDGTGAVRLLVVVIALLVLALTVMLFLTFLVRIGVLVALVGIAPAALACHGLPQLDSVARFWWRSLLATLGTVTAQGFLLHAGLTVFLSPQANLPSLGLPVDPGGIVNLFIVVCLLWTTVRVPAVLARIAVRGGTRTPGAYLIRAVLMQQLARSVRRLALHP
jgi:hypothetical protein